MYYIEQDDIVVVPERPIISRSVAGKRLRILDERLAIRNSVNNFVRYELNGADRLSVIDNGAREKMLLDAERVGTANATRAH